MPISVYRCPKCEIDTTDITYKISDVRVTFPCEKCGEEVPKSMAAHGSYKIMGDNSSSVTPKKFRG